MVKKEQACEQERRHEINVQRARENVLGKAEIEKICAIFRVLADPTRMRIVLALLQGDMCVYHLMEACEGATQSGVSHQLRILRDNKIVKTRRVGKNIEYSIADGHVCEIVKMGIAHLACEVEA